MADQQYPAPTAPPRGVVDPHAPPPTYEDVIEHDQHRPSPAAQVANTLTRSMAFAGRSLGRFFNVHDNRELEGWQRAGTLPRNRYAVGYSPVTQEDDDTAAAQIALGNRQEQQQQQEGQGRGAGKRGRGRGRMRRVTDTLTRAIPGRRKKEPTREEVMKTLPKFWPVVTVLIALLEVSMLVALIVTGGLAPISFTPKSELKVVTGFDNISVSADRQIVPNFFIGTSKVSLVHAGGLYTPCMRENVAFQVSAAKDRVEEENLRCCLSSAQKQCGMLPQEICRNVYGGQVLGGASTCRAEMNNTDLCVGGITLHPCCIGLLGQCIITTQENCTFQEGVWHGDQLLCGEVGADCFNDICKFTHLWADSIAQPSQGLRFVSAMFLYDGAITLVIIGLLKLYNSWSIEKRIGFLRIICIYILSGIGGFLLSGIFDPTSVSVGGSGALFGMLGVLFVELLQGWRWVQKPWVELIKLTVMMIIALMLGTLPYIDNFSQIGGFIFGVLASFIFVPYIIIGKWDRAKKLCLILTAVPIILALFFVGFVVFYNMSDPNFCPQCSYINCIPYTDTFCDDFISTLLRISPV